MRIAGLLGANALIVAVGLGALPLLGAARSWRELASRSGLAYLCGLAIVGGLSAQLALIRFSFGWIALVLLASVLVLVGGSRLVGTELPRWQRPEWLSVAGALAVAGVLAEYSRAFAVAPLDRYDAWALWTLKGHVLYAFGWADPVVFAGSSYRILHMEYPLLLPSLEAIDFRAMGAFDTRLIHLQFLLMLVAALAAWAAVVRDLVPSSLLWASLLAFVLAPSMFDQLLSAYADLPLALFFAGGAAAAARWLVTNERWALSVAALFFAAALLTKNEGSLFVLAAFLGLAFAAPHRWRALAAVAAVEILAILPWRVFTKIYNLRGADFRLSDSFDFGRVASRIGLGPRAFATLGQQMIDPRQWGFLFVLFLAVVAAAFLLGLRALPLYSVVLAAVSWLGLTWIYVITHLNYRVYVDSTKERVISSVVLGTAAVMPLLAAEAWRFFRGDVVGSRSGLGGDVDRITSWRYRLPPAETVSWKRVRGLGTWVGKRRRTTSTSGLPEAEI
jgi:hypothetical protein